MSYPLFFELGLALAALRAWRAGEAARRAMRDGKSSMAEYRKVAREDGMESLLLHFRHLIPMAKVEAVSLFDVATYKIFDQFSVTPQAE